MVFFEWFCWVFENFVNCWFKEDLWFVIGFCSCVIFKFFKEENWFYINLFLDLLDFSFKVEIRVGKELKLWCVFGVSYICKFIIISL